MIYQLTDLNSWPLKGHFDPILKSTNDAFEYARLIFKSEKHQKPLSFFRQQTIRAVKRMKQSQNPDPERMLVVAMTAQFYRECLEEVERIKVAQPGYFTNPNQEVTNA